MTIKIILKDLRKVVELISRRRIDTVLHSQKIFNQYLAVISLSFIAYLRSKTVQIRNDFCYQCDDIIPDG
jgi:hypothetical protein